MARALDRLTAATPGQLHTLAFLSVFSPDEFEQTLAAGQLRAARAVSNVLVETYWQIGREIIARLREQSWGARVIERLSADLRTTLRGVRAQLLRPARRQPPARPCAQRPDAGHAAGGWP
jgi:hypothetical protein